MIAELDLAGLKVMLAEATPGPWTVTMTGAAVRAMREYKHGDGSSSVVNTRICFGYDGNHDQRQIDYSFIAAARSDLPVLIERIEALEEALKPFAEAADAFNDCEQHPNGCPDSAQAGELVDLTVGDFRRARSALTPTKGR